MAFPGHTLLFYGIGWTINTVLRVFKTPANQIPENLINMLGFYISLVRVFSDVLVAFLYSDICHNRQSNLAIENPEFSQPVVAGHFQ